MKHTKGPWMICGMNKSSVKFDICKTLTPETEKRFCGCGMIWCDDYPIAIVTVGDWGDEYPAIKVENPGAIAEPAVPYIEKLVYGTIPIELALANALLISKSPNMKKLLERAVESRIDDAWIKETRSLLKEMEVPVDDN